MPPAHYLHRVCQVVSCLINDCSNLPMAHLCMATQAHGSYFVMIAEVEQLFFVNFYSLGRKCKSYQAFCLSKKNDQSHKCTHTQEEQQLRHL